MREHAARTQQPGGQRDDGRDQRQPVRPGEDRLGRVVRDLGADRRSQRDVGRVADDGIDATVELGQQAGVGDVAGDDLDRRCRRQLRRSQVSAGRRPLDREDPRARHLVRDRDAPAHPNPRTDRRRSGGRRRGTGRQHGVDQQFGLGPRDEHARPDLDRHESEGCVTGQVLQRLASGPARRLVRRSARRPVVDVGGRPQRRPGDAEDVREQQLGIDPGRADPGRGQRRGGLVEQFGRDFMTCRAAPAMSACISASITSSRAPSSTWSRL